MAVRTILGPAPTSSKHAFFMAPCQIVVALSTSWAKPWTDRDEHPVVSEYQWVGAWIRAFNDFEAAPSCRRFTNNALWCYHALMWLVSSVDPEDLEV